VTQQANLEISTSPFVGQTKTTPAIMKDVLLALIPVLGVAIYYFGITALIMVLVTTFSAVLTEWFFATDRKGLGSIGDGSAILTGVLLGLVLPPSIPLWMAFLGGAIGVGLGKIVWGGLGFNVFNPALLGRAFLQAAFPEAMTTWTPPKTGFFHFEQTTFAMPLMHASVDGLTAATPLGQAKFDGVVSQLGPLFMGNISGSMGETSALLLILCGVWLGFRKTFDWRLPVSTLLAVVALSFLLQWIAPDKCAGPGFMLLSGGLIFGAVFMVTDPVTTPITSRGMWIFGGGVGILVVLIRVYGGLPEGVMFAILLMNSVTPLINRYTQPRIFGGQK